MVKTKSYFLEKKQAKYIKDMIISDLESCCCPPVPFDKRILMRCKYNRFDENFISLKEYNFLHNLYKALK